MTKHLLKIIREMFPSSDIQMHSKLITEGHLDSMDIIILVQEIEKHMGIKISGSNITKENFDTVASIAKLLETYNV